jgi:hypothetical protein
VSPSFDAEDERSREGHFEAALTLARNAAERRFLARRVADCG